MTDRIISLETSDPREIYGPNDQNLNALKDLFPKLKIIARGDIIKITGSADDLNAFEKLFDFLLMHYERFGRLTIADVNEYADKGEAFARQASDNEVIVYGRSGNPIKALTPNQKRIVESIAKNDMVFAIGPAGTGKTYTAVALAVRALKNREVKRIVLTRPAVEAGENLGFLPGDLKDKLDPYLQPLYDALRDMIPPQKLLTYMQDGTIEIAPLAFMRGRTLENVFAILDEAQNATAMQLKMFLTRMGRTSKFFVTGDMTQIDLPRNQQSGLVQASRILEGIPGIDFVSLDQSDVVRHKLVTRIIEAYEKNTPPIA